MSGSVVSVPARRLHRVVRRLAWDVLGGAVVLLASIAVTFFALRLTPGDPVRALLGGANANPSPATIAATIKAFGLDKPLPVQFWLYLSHLLHGDLGLSFSQHLPVATVLQQQLWPSLQLTFAALVLAWALALASVLATAGRVWWLEELGIALETISASIPQFWLAIVLLSLFAFTWPIFPPEGNDGVASLVLPAIAMALPLAGYLAQVTRESFSIALEQPFIISARARGLSDTAVRLRHVLRHAVLPGIGITVWAIGGLIGNAVLIETIFSRQGLGRQLFSAITFQDMPLTIGITLLVTLAYVLSRIAADALYLLVDPRLKIPQP